MPFAQIYCASWYGSNSVIAKINHNWVEKNYRNIFFSPLPRGEFLRDLHPMNQARILSTRWGLKRGFLERLTRKGNFFQRARKAAASADAVLATILIMNREFSWDDIDGVRRNLLSNLMNDHDNFSKLWKKYCKLVRFAVLNSEPKPDPPREIRWASKVAWSIDPDDKTRLLTIFNSRSMSPAGWKIQEESMEEWMTTVTTLPPEIDANFDLKCLETQYEFRPVITETSSFKFSREQGGKMKEVQQIVVELLSNNPPNLINEFGKEVTLDSLRTERPEPIPVIGIADGTYGGNIFVSKGFLTINDKISIDWGKALVYWAIARIMQDPNKHDRVFVSTVKEPGKARIITAPEIERHILLSALAHTFRRTVSWPEARAGLTTSRNGWEFYRSSSTDYLGTGTPQEDSCYIGSDLERATDIPPFTAGKSVYRKMGEASNLPNFLIELLVDLCGPRRAFTKRSQKDPVLVTTRGIPMGDPCTKYVLTYLHQQAITRTVMRIGSKEVNFFKPRWRINGDDFIAEIHHGIGRAFLEAYKQECTSLGMKVSELDSFYSTKIGYYCEEGLIVRESRLQNYEYTISNRGRFPMLDIVKSRLLNTYPSESPTLLESLMGKAAALGVSLRYAREPFSRLWPAEAWEQANTVLYCLTHPRVKDEWINHPLSHSNYMPIPKGLKWRPNFEHGYAVNQLRNRLGWDGKSFNPTAVSEYHTLRRRQFRNQVVIRNQIGSLPLTPINLNVRAQIYGNLIDLPNDVINEDHLIAEMLKRIQFLGNLFGLDLNKSIYQEFDVTTIPRLYTTTPEEWEKNGKVMHMIFRSFGPLYWKEELSQLQWKVMSLSGEEVLPMRDPTLPPINSLRTILEPNSSMVIEATDEIILFLAYQISNRIVLYSLDQKLIQKVIAAGVDRANCHYESFMGYMDMVMLSPSNGQIVLFDHGYTKHPRYQIATQRDSSWKTPGSIEVDVEEYFTPFNVVEESLITVKESLAKSQLEP
jgi:hypothetical protein